MSNLAIINLKRISKEVCSNYLASQAKQLKIIPNFFDKWNYIEKYCDVVVLKDEKVLKDIEDLVKSSICFDGYNLCIKNDEFLQFEINKMVADALKPKYEEVLKLIKEADDIYISNKEKFIDSRVIKILNSAPHEFETEEYYYDSSVHYEVFNLFLSLLYHFQNAHEDYNDIIKKCLNYIYISCDSNMLKVFDNKSIKYEDFLEIFIDDNQKIREYVTLLFGTLEKLPEMYRSIRVYG